MKKNLTGFAGIFFIFFFPLQIFAWGKTGHSIVPEIAFHYLDDQTKKNVEDYLKNTSIEDAANWMDEIRSDHNYDYMKPWHFIDINKGESYQPCSDNNIIWELKRVIAELPHKNVLPADEIRLDLLILFHLIGDLHQPLHTGYDSDRGGNSIKLTFLTLPSNLHKVWDEGIIDNQHIVADDCITLCNTAYTNGTITELKNTDSLDLVDWLNQSRSLLDEVYDFKDNNLDMDYCLKNKVIIEKQLFIAGIRLAAVLKKYFSAVTGSPEVKIAIPRGTIAASDAIRYIGKEETVCGKEFGGRFFETSNGAPTLLNVGAAFPNSPFTVVIFGDSRKNFSYKPEEFLTNKVICVKGTIKEFHGKAEIVVTKESDIKIVQ